MGLLTLTLRLPFLPVQGVVRLAELIQDEAERQLHDPAAVRAELEQAEQLRAEGAISDDELADWQRQAISRLTSVHSPLRHANADGS